MHHELSVLWLISQQQVTVVLALFTRACPTVMIRHCFYCVASSLHFVTQNAFDSLSQPKIPTIYYRHRKDSTAVLMGF